MRLGEGYISVSKEDMEKQAIVAGAGKLWGGLKRALGGGGKETRRLIAGEAPAISGTGLRSRWAAGRRAGLVGTGDSSEYMAQGGRAALFDPAAAETASTGLAKHLNVSPQLARNVMSETAGRGGRRAIRTAVEPRAAASLAGEAGAISPSVAGIQAQFLPRGAQRTLRRQARQTAAGGGDAAQRAQIFEARMTGAAPTAHPAAPAAPPPATAPAATAPAATARPTGRETYEEMVARLQREAGEKGAERGAQAGAEEATKGGLWSRLPLWAKAGIPAGGVGGAYLYGEGEADRRAQQQMEQWLLNAGYLQQPYGYG